MWYVATYDVSDDRRRESIAALLGRFGSRVQLSVFEVQLDENELDLVLAAIGRILETPENGSVRLYRWCLACRGTSVGVGDVEEADDGAA